MRFIWMSLVVLVVFSLAACDDDNTPANSNGGSTGPAGQLFVLNQDDTTMFIYDTKTMTRTDSVHTGVKLPHYIEFSPDGQNYYIVNLVAPGQIGKYNVATHELLQSVAVPPSVMPSAIVISADSKYGYICNFTQALLPSQIHKYDLTTMQHVDQFMAGATTHDLKITSDGEVIVACNRFSDNLTLIFTTAEPDTVTFVDINPDSTYPVPSNKYGPFGVAISHSDSLAYIACVDAQQVRVLDIAQATIVDSIDIPIVGTTGGRVDGPTLLAVSPDDKVVWVTTQGGNSVVAFSTSTMEIVADIPFSTPFPFGISMSDDGSRVYVACINVKAKPDEPQPPGMVYVIDGASYQKLDSIAVGNQSFGLIWQPPAN